jgi:hypothetical protein
MRLGDRSKGITLPPDGSDELLFFETMLTGTGGMGYGGPGFVDDRDTNDVVKFRDVIWSKVAGLAGAPTVDRPVMLVSDRRPNPLLNWPRVYANLSTRYPCIDVVRVIWDNYLSVDQVHLTAMATIRWLAVQQWTLCLGPADGGRFRTKFN